MATKSRMELVDELPPSRIGPVDELLPLVRKVYPGWKGFRDPRFLSEERSYKDEAVELARSLLDRGELLGLLSSGAHSEVVNRVRQVAKKTNLLYLGHSTGDLAPLKAESLPIEQRAELVVDLLYGNGSSGERLDRYRERLAAAGVPARWPLPTYLLFLLSPEEVFVKPSVVKWLFGTASVSSWLSTRVANRPSEWVGYQATVSSDLYRVIRLLHHDIGVELKRRSHPPLDMIDVQSFIWVAYFGAHKQQPPPVDDEDADRTTHRRGRVPIHHDAPAAVDELGRRPFAEVLARRIRQSFRFAAAGGVPSAFAVHLHGPWGSGKTSVLNFLEDELRKGERAPGSGQAEARGAENHGPEARWIVVRFDAWKHQRIRPPWWPLIREVYEQAGREPRQDRRWRPFRVWWGWKLRASLLPLVLTVATVVAFAFFFYFLSTPAGGRFDLGATVSLLGGLAALFGALQTKNRSLLLGSSKAAEAYLELSSDPLGPLSKFFERLTGSFGRPLAVLVDDLDRCDADSVVDLLEGIQTLFRQAPVVYVVAADREWIRTSFERRYASFVGNVGEPGRPLGHLFLEKLFQISLQVPRLAQDTRLEYWQRLIASGEAQSTEEAQERLVEEGDAILGKATSPDDIQRVVDEQKGKKSETAVRIAAAQKLSTPEAVAETEHFLEPYAPLLEPNPRAMKRLVNAFGLHQAVNLLSHIDVQPDALAAWTIVQQRWPQLADLLSEQPDLLPAIGQGQAPDVARVPESLHSLFGSPSVRRVLAGEGERPGLDEESLRRLVGEPSRR